MTSGWSPPDDRPVGRGTIEPELAAVGYPDEYRPLPPAPPTGPPPASAPDESTTETTRHEAGEIVDTAKDAGAQVVESAKEQVGAVTREAGRQTRDLLDQLRSEATDQAATQQQRAAGGLRSLADELSGMASRSEQDGPATDLARQAADRLQDVAQWLENRNPGDVLDEVRSFARRRPGAYLALAAGAGMLAGRLTRGLTSHDDGDERSRRSVDGPVNSGGRPAMSTAGGGPQRPVVTPPPVRVPPEASLVPAGPTVPDGPGATRTPYVTPESVGMTEQPASSAFTVPAPSAGSASDIRR